MRWACVLAIGVAGCHWVFPHSVRESTVSADRGDDLTRLDVPRPPPDGRPSDGRPSDGRPDARLPDSARLPDLRPDSAPTCIEEHFTAATGWAVTMGLGTWSWVAPTRVSQADIAVLNSYALVTGSQGAAVQSSVTTVDLTVKNLLSNEYSHGAGVSLMVTTGSAAYPGSQVACVVVQAPLSGAASLAIIYYDGVKMDVGKPAEATPLASPILGKPLTLTMTVAHTVSAWTMTCEVTGAVYGKAIKDVTPQVTGTPIGIAIATYTAAAEFDRVKVCPK